MNFRKQILMIVTWLVCSSIFTGALAEGGTLTLPGSLKIIEAEAFLGNLSANNVIVPEGVEEIHSKAFANAQLTLVELPQSVTFIAEDAFDHCEALSIVALEDSYAYDWAIAHNCLVAPGIVRIKAPSWAEPGSTVTFTVYTEFRADYLRMYDSDGSEYTTWRWDDDGVTWEGGAENTALWSIEYTFSSEGLLTFGFCASVDGEKFGATTGMTITVSEENPADQCDGFTAYRALLISETHFERETAIRNQKDADLIEKMLGGVEGATGGAYAISKRDDASQSDIESLIRSQLADGADGDDVALFFIASHGDSSSTGRYAGAIELVDGSFMPIEDLASWLSEVPGKVIVFIEACGSGAGIYANNSGRAPQLAETARAFDESVIRAFSEADADIAEKNRNQDDHLGKTSELRTNKFYVLTASQYLENSYGWQNDSGTAGNNFFTAWLSDGVGLSGDMPADQEYAGNANGVVDLHELYSYISGEGDAYAITIDDQDFYQHVQVYPAETRYELFR